MLSGDGFIMECCVATLTQLISIGADIATSPIITISIVAVIPHSLLCGLNVTRRGASQGEGRAAQQQQGQQHPGVRREEQEEPSSDQISQGPGD